MAAANSGAIEWGAGRLSAEAEARFVASGMVAPHRAKDLFDVQELIRSAGLSSDVAMELHPWVRDKFLELWRLAQTPDPF